VTYRRKRRRKSGILNANLQAQSSAAMQHNGAPFEPHTSRRSEGAPGQEIGRHKQAGRKEKAPGPEGRVLRLA
jgi:hypothetical protein